MKKRISLWVLSRNEQKWKTRKINSLSFDPEICAYRNKSQQQFFIDSFWAIWDTHLVNDACRKNWNHSRVEWKKSKVIRHNHTISQKFEELIWVFSFVWLMRVEKSERSIWVASSMILKPVLDVVTLINKAFMSLATQTWEKQLSFA